MYVLAYLMSANDNVKHIKSNIRYVFDNKINKMNYEMWKYARFQVYEIDLLCVSVCMFALVPSELHFRTPAH